MKKSLFPLIFILLSTTIVHAQTDFGIKGGVNFTNYGYGDQHAPSEAESITSFHLAGYLVTRLAPALYLQPEVSLQNKGARVIKTDAVDGAAEIIQRTKWLDIPINVLGKMPIGNNGNVFAGGGPYIGFAMSGENTYTDGSTSAVIIYKDNDLRSVDYGINFLAGIKFGFLSLHASYSFGLANITYDTNNWSKNLKNRALSLGIGISFASLHQQI
ncbi:outer membrane beta-barrel protein [Parapedobacter sp. 10938]|uniref:outer membrane beta-barrel protein n=1 Tax=Parapedobacter flavus TaxID=3110225 RepID=UPI002DBBD091|nr:outer membrane beta-barrel protein [Parapedobacter sp. 10938]MEC3879729.1 outer membrane beta-barrel protein [Parapedobacter sp. 10938]